MSEADLAATAKAWSENDALHWQHQKSKVLAEFKMTGTVSVSGDLVGDSAAAAAAAGQGASMAVARSRQRLEALTSGAQRSSGQTLSLSQSEYSEMIHRMHEDLRLAWEGGDYVKAIKIAIQCCKLLGVPSVPAFYPSMFVLVTSVLDTFGALVFRRLKRRAEDGLSDMARAEGTKRRITLPDNFRPQDIGSEAREMARNWLFKTACIRELLPRLYMECALLETYRFLSEADFAAILTRLSHTVRGLADPMVASYARWYLARALHRLVGGNASAERAAVLEGVQDFFATYTQVRDAKTLASLEATGFDPTRYVHLFTPALRWQFHQLATACVLADGGSAGEVTRSTFQGVMRMYKSATEERGDMTVLWTVLDAFPGQLYCAHLPSVLQLVEAAVPTTAVITQHMALAAIARQVAGAPSVEFPQEHRLPFLNDSWSLITQLSVGEIGVFLKCADAFMRLLAAHFGRVHLQTLLKDVTRHVLRYMRQQAKEALHRREGGVAQGEGGAEEEANAPEVASTPEDATVLDGEALGHLQGVLCSVMRFEADLTHADAETVASKTEGAPESLVASDLLPRVLDAFDSRRKQAVCQQLLALFNGCRGHVSDRMLVHTVVDISRNVALGLDALSTVDTRRTVDALLVAFVQKLDFGRDLEGQLSSLAQARETLPPSDAVNEAITLAGLRLVWHALQLVSAKAARKGAKGGAAAHTAATATFVKTAIAFVHVTVPVLSDPLRRMQLFAAEGAAAHANGCTSQADAAYRCMAQELSACAAGDEERGVKRITEEQLVQFVLGVLPDLVVMPGSPQLGPFYLFRGLHTALSRVEWTAGRSLKAQAVLAMLPCLAAMGQMQLPADRLPAGAQWNGSLYGGDVEYDAELTQLVISLVEELFTASDALAAGACAGDVLAGTDHAQLASDLFKTVVGTMHLGKGVHAGAGGLRKLLRELWSQLNKNPSSAARLARTALAQWTQEHKADIEEEHINKNSPVEHQVLTSAAHAFAVAAEVVEQ